MPREPGKAGTTRLAPKTQFSSQRDSRGPWPPPSFRLLIERPLAFSIRTDLIVLVLGLGLRGRSDESDRDESFR